VAAKNKDDEGNERRVFARSKSNIGPDDGGFEYSLEQVEALTGIWASRVVWGNVLTGTAKSLLAEQDEDDGNGSDAVDLLREALNADSWTNVNEVQNSITSYGFTKKQVWFASKRLNVIRKRGGYQGAMYWRLPSGANLKIPDLSIDPQNPSIDSIDSTSKNRESIESLRVSGINDEPQDYVLDDQGVSI
jgi:putative DNA primase/helicase